MIVIQDTFSFTDPTYGTFTDAIVLPQAQYSALKASDLQALKQARFDAWVSLMKNPPAPIIVPPVQQVEAIDNQLEQLAIQRDDIIAATNVIDPLDASAAPGLQLDTTGDPLVPGQ
jgi:hypothetical protein